jgi:hypothetical protein
MRTRVTFRYLTKFVGAKEDEGILGIGGVSWFVERLARIPRLSISTQLIQDDWGVAIRAERDGNKFWIGISSFDDGVWVAHIHYFLGTWLRSLISASHSGTPTLAYDLDRVLKSDPSMSDIRWYRERDMKRPPFSWRPNPTDA